MDVQLTPDGVVEARPRWRLLTRIAFRFSVLYFGLYILLTQMFAGINPFGGVPVLSTVPPVGPAVMWVIRNVFKDDRQLTMLGGSGDKMFDWVFALCLVAFSATVTLLWSILDRRRPSYVRLQKWFRLWLRFGVGTTMLSYGMAKFIPMQMPFPLLTRLLEPFGNFSPMGVLWYSIGASPAYESIVGSAEILAGVLLFIPLTTTLGGLVSLICSIHIFILNMTYDVPVKLFSFHLLLMSLVILAPDIPRLVNLFVLNRPTLPSTQTPLGRRRLVVGLGMVAQIILGGYFVWTQYRGATDRWHRFAGGAPKPPLYGIWTIDRMTIDGVERAALVTDYDRWRRVVIQTAGSITFWRMDDSFVAMPATVDAEGKTISLVQGPARTTVGTFTFEQSAPDRLTFDGTLNGQKIRMETTLFPRERFLLVTRGFNWIQEAPFNR